MPSIKFSLPENAILPICPICGETDGVERVIWLGLPGKYHNDAEGDCLCGWGLAFGAAALLNWAGIYPFDGAILVYEGSYFWALFRWLMEPIE